jgi:phosphoglycerol transferase MdoB-like AlkP superfamily enzyme
LLFIIIVLIFINKIHCKLKITPKLNLKLCVLSVAGIILIYQANPIRQVFGIISFPMKRLTSYLLLLDANNMNLVIKGQMPILFSEVFRDKNDYITLEHIPEKYSPLINKYNLFNETFKCSSHKNHDVYKRVILLTVESLSLDFTNYETNLCNVAIMPHIDALMTEYSAGAIRTTASPTIYGLSSMFSSHPNSKLVIDKQYPNSFVRILKNNGYKTIFFRSAPEKYANEHIKFKQAGFEEIYGRDFFRNKADLSPYIHSWGLEDAFLYKYILDFLKQNKNEKLFLHIMPVDTHIPYGREVYSTPRPELPNDLNCSIDNTRLVKSFNKADYDIGVFVSNLKKEGLLDEQTLLIITADHSVPPIYHPAPEVLDRIPLIFISKKKIEGLKLAQPDISQIDIAPTILDLLGLSSPQEYWGYSLFDKIDRTYFGIHNKILTIRDNSHIKQISMEHPASATDSELIDLMNTVFILPNHL